MSETAELSDYHILIGGEDIIWPHLQAILGDDSENVENQEKARKKLSDLLKEMRVKFGTLLKTDNVSFLFGAGASIKAGGVSLASIPIPLEKMLIERAAEEKGDSDKSSWIALFYAIASMLSGSEWSHDDRKDLLENDEQDDTAAIPVNLEDYLSHLHMWLAGMAGETTTLQLSGKTKLKILKSDLERLISEITECLTKLLDLPKANVDVKDPLRWHQRFVKKILTRPLNLRRAGIFTLNYDTLIEQAADADGAVLVDGFVGSLRRVFRPESYDIDFYFPAQTTEGRVHRYDRALHLYKLHGSITWHRCGQDWENPFGLYATFFDQDCAEHDVVIYPSPLKYGQALQMPYSELFRRFGNTIAQPQSVLFVIGYGFGDEHINALIKQATAIPSFTLVVVDPDPKSDFVSELEQLKDERVWIVKGSGLGTFERFVERLLPDLREEEIEAKVMRTFKSLSLAKEQTKEVGEDGDS